MLKNAFGQGWAAALAHFKLADAQHGYSPGGTSLNPAQTASTAMATSVPKQVMSPTAPIAPNASKASVL